MVTGLMPNQVCQQGLRHEHDVTNDLAYPKVVYDKTRLQGGATIGAAIPISGGDVNNVAKIIDLQISPQIA